MSRSDDLPTTSPKVAALLARRAERLRTDSVDEDFRSTTEIAEFTVGDETYAVLLSTVRGAIPLRRVAPVPLAPPHVLGLVRFEGRLVTAMSLAALLGGVPWGTDPTTLLVVETDVPDHLVAVDCEQIPKATALLTATVERARADHDAVTPLTAPGSRLVHLVDLPRLIGAKERGEGSGRDR